LSREADLVLFNSRQLISLAFPSRQLRRGQSLADIGIIENGALASLDGTLVAVGTREEVERSISPVPGCREVDAGGSVVMPGFVDCHTHTVFADYRVEEYEWRVMGTPYEEIARRGGGIAKSVSDLRNTTEEDLLRVSVERVKNCIANGTTTLEIKSGYGLDLENELKQLRVIRVLAEQFPCLIIPTFLGAHSVPPEYSGKRDAFIELVINEMIPVVAREGLAEYVDVFSEKGVFEREEAERILRAGIMAGLKARLHADELHDTDSAGLAVSIGAMSADHLTKISTEGLERMAQSQVVAVLLPGTSFGLPSLDFAPARRLIDNGVAVAIASDFNPGSSPSESMPMMCSIACSHMGMSPAEAIAASTYNASFVVSREDEVGSLETDKRTDFLILNAEDYREIPYRFGINPVSRVFIKGHEWLGEPTVKP